MKMNRTMMTLIAIISLNTLFFAACSDSPSIESTVESDVTSTQAYDLLRLKWYNKLIGGQYNPADPDIAAALSQLENKVANANQNGYWDTLDKTSDRTNLWSDLTSTTDSSHISSAYGRLTNMALAYSIEGTNLYQNVDLKDDILSAMEWMYANRYNETKNPYGNWWEWEIGTPHNLNNLVVLMYDHLTQDQANKYMKAVDKFNPDPKFGTVLGVKGVPMGGANLLDKALAVTLRGIIGKDDSKIAQGRDAIGPEFNYTTRGDGVYKDGSLVQHGVIAYTAGYGAVWLKNAAEMSYLLADSPWPITDPNVLNIYDWIPQSFEPMIYNGIFMDMVNGRGISRQGSGSARSLIVTMIRLADTAPADKVLPIKRMAKSWIMKDATYVNYYDGLSLYDIATVKNLMNDDSIQPKEELIKNQVFSGMDRVVHLREGYGFGISMFSNRISAFEKGNNENLKGWYTGTGMTYLYDRDMSRYRNDFWPTVDPFRLPGTTTDGSGKGVTPGEWKSYMNTKTWVGGSSIDGLYGAAGMDFSLERVTGSKLQGKKSWFMFDDEIVALGAGISSTKTGPQPVETIIDNRMLNDAGDNAFTINGTAQSSQLGSEITVNNVEWAHLAGNVPGTDIGYYFPENSNVYVKREARTGAWKDINARGSVTPITRNYLNLAFEHGETPSNATYAYVMLPHMDASATASYAGQPDVDILSNTSDIHAIRENKLGITAANFWKAGTVDFIRSYEPASVMVRLQGDELTLSVSDPTQTQNKITIDLGKKAHSVISQDDTVTMTRKAPYTRLEIDTTGSIGRTHTIKLKIKPNAKGHLPANS